MKKPVIIGIVVFVLISIVVAVKFLRPHPAEEEVASSVTQQENKKSSDTSSSPSAPETKKENSSPSASKLNVSEVFPNDIEEPPRFTIEDWQQRRALLKQKSEKFRQDMMKKIEALAGKEDQMGPEELIKVLYKDDPSTYSKEKEAYIEQIAKPFMGAMADQEFVDSNVDFTPIMSSAYDIMEDVDKRNLKKATIYYMKLPDAFKDDSEVKESLKDFQQKLSTMNADQTNNFIIGFQNGRKVPENLSSLSKVSAKANEFGKDTKDNLEKFIEATAILHSYNK